MKAAYDKYIKFMSEHPNATADANVYNAIGNAYILNSPLFIQYSKTTSMNKHIGYIYYGNHSSPPKGFKPVSEMI